MSEKRPATPKQAEVFFARDVVFAAGAAKPEMLPREAFPEIAFIGRSNVGKSSLLNALLARKMAHVSNTPGRTQQLNFFRLGDRAMLVDMPGYGYAKAPDKNVKAWGVLVETYLEERRTLKRLCLLIDARHGPNEKDRAFLHFLNVLAVPFVVVLTKTDKIKPAELETLKTGMESMFKDYASAWPVVFATSAETGEGIAALRLFLAQTLF